ncbi:uncharacterized protein [Branchiostoma lanceolatum]|uniref:uncharacterized protein n=1 Tax=Branchiostoma lanceolatum TaxID=7740 RepID=UPI003456C011
MQQGLPQFGFELGEGPRLRHTRLKVAPLFDDIPRLHFAGWFLADQSTFNNKAENWNITTFKPDRAPGWNTHGSAAFRLFDCAVTRVCLANGTCLDDVDDDPIVINQSITGSDGTVAAKMVDLDPDQQFQSQLWGLVVGVNGSFQGDFVPRSFNGGRTTACDQCIADRHDSAYYISRLINVNWFKEEQRLKNSTFLKDVMALRCKTGFQLYVKLNMRLMNVNQSSPNFPFGRVFGTIFAAVADTPVPQGPYKRMLWGNNNSYGKLFDAPFYVDEQRKKVVVDFANSVDTDPHGNVINIPGRLFLIQCNHTQCSNCEVLGSARLNIGEISSFSKSWLHQTAGVIEFSLTDGVAEDVLSTPLAVMEIINETTCKVLLQERLDGVFVSSVDEPVFRKEPGENWSVTLRAFQFGKPIAGALLEPDLLNNDTAVPVDAVAASPASTDANGTAQINFVSQDPGEPRADQQLDGQVYIYGLNVTVTPGMDPFPVGDLMISVHLYSDYKLSGKPTWYKDIYPIFQQYANLYPVMKPIVDLASYEDVTKEPNHRMLKYALELPIEDPNYMPVTRDLSPKKRDMILFWLDDNDNNEGRPPLGRVNINNLNDIKTALQTAIQLELATIPPYLSALFSIKEGCNEEVAALIQGIVVEEMQHLALVANLLNAVGGTPVVNTQNVVPSYPSSLPGGANPDLTVTLGRCSLDQIQNVFQKIETPECSLSTSPVTELFRHRKFNSDGVFDDEGLKKLKDKCKESRSQYNPQTIGAIYIHQILCPMLILELHTNKMGATIFVGNRSKQLTRKQWYGSASDVPFAVTGITTAIKAIAYIVMEGEGSDPCNPFDQYGELSHYFKFAEIAHGRRLVRTDNNACPSPMTLKSETTTDHPSSQKISSDKCYRTTQPSMFDDHVRFRPCKEDAKCSTSFHFVGPIIPFYQNHVWPTVSNPRSDMYPPDTKARRYSDIFTKVYSDLLICLNEAFNGHTDRMGRCMGMMKSLKVWANKLVRTPIDPNGDPNIGPNAAPTFEFSEPSM